jgi:Zn-dependent M28 family amino/carboxypeptidase
VKQRADVIFRWAAVLGALALGSCSGNQAATGQAAGGPAPQGAAQDAAPPAASTGGFDGRRAYQHVAELVAIGPRSAGTEGGRRAQEYIVGQLQSFGCVVEQAAFRASTPIGVVEMKNIIAKIPGASSDILLFTTHYDTKRMADFVGADDGGSSSGVMLELARSVCRRQNALTVWIAFFDGEEAFNQDWVDPDNTYGSRELAARMALSGELKNIRAMVLADLVGNRNLRLKRESQSTPWLTDLVWSTAARLGYERIFVSDSSAVEDDHIPFLRRGVAAVDIIDLENPQDDNYWHKPSDTLDKVSARSLAVVGHVLIETLPQLEKRFSPATNR